MINIDKTVDKFLRIEATEKNKAEILDQYKVAVDTLKSTQGSRSSTNSFYVSITSFLIPVTSFIFNSKIYETNKYYIIIINAIIGLILSSFWLSELKRFYRVIQVLENIIIKIEVHLPINIFHAENKILAITDTPTKTEKQELMIPYTLGIIYFIILLATMYKLLT